MQNNWLRQPRIWVELFALFNLGGLAPDIFLAHSTNHFHARVEWAPLIFSAAAPVFLLAALGALLAGKVSVWRVLGNLTGWISVFMGVVGLLLHLKSQFFQEWTLASLVYTAPFAAPLAYTGLGLLLILNRSVDAKSVEWGEWVIILALGGFIGNFIFGVTDHAQNGFFWSIEWIPVIASALAIGFLSAPLIVRVGAGFFTLCFVLLTLEALVGVAGFGLHLRADLHGVGNNLFENIVHGAPVLAPLLFPNMALLGAIGLWSLRANQKNPASSY